jgi:hypothetical protein
LKDYYAENYETLTKEKNFKQFNWCWYILYKCMGRSNTVNILILFPVGFFFFAFSVLQVIDFSIYACALYIWMYICICTWIAKKVK